MDRCEMERQLERHHRESYGWALSCCYQDLEEAEEVLQTAYLKIVEGKAKYSGRSMFRTWLFSVIRLTAIDSRRRRIRRRLRFARLDDQNVDPDPGPGPGEGIDRSRVRALVRRAMRELPDRQREVIQLHFYHELSLKEAAEVMGVSIGSARTHYDRGKKALRLWMSERKISSEL